MTIINNFEYKKCNVEYRVYGENKAFSATAWIHIPRRSTEDKQPIELDKSYELIEDAETAIINKAKQWIDEQLKNGNLIPIDPDD